jgi:hypothetical protein
MRRRYVQDLHQLRNFGACVHLLQDPPAAVIVDDLAHLLANTRWVGFYHSTGLGLCK